MALHSCQIVNETGQTIFLKIVGHEPTSYYYPDLFGVETGVLMAAAPLNQDLHLLAEGVRMVLAWNNDGKTLLATQQIEITDPCTISIKVGSVTKHY